MKSSKTSPFWKGAAALTVITLAAVTAVTADAPAAAQVREGSADVSTQDGPAPGQRGRLLTARPLTTAAALPSARSNHLITYRSTDAAGLPVVVSGTVSLPRSPKPSGGWPVISWAHGTTGTADACAPSADTADGPAHDYLSLVDETLDAWVAKGYVVVKTDYEGLGTRGPHPYMNGESAANSVLDIVRAARGLDRRVGRHWTAIGHSQGGHAALYAAARQEHVRDVHLLGAVSIAPGGVGLSQIAPYIRSGGPGAAAAVAFLPSVLIGAAAVDPAVVPEELLTERARPLLDAARTGCMEEIREVAATIPPEDVFRPDADLGPLTRYLQTQEPTGLTLRVPTLVAQGTDDTLVSKPSTDHLVSSLCEKYPSIGYRVYEGADHRETVAASLHDAEQFVDALSSGRTPDASC